MKRLKNDSGSLTVEAALVLPLFIAGFLVITMLAATVRAQVVVQYAINQTAKEVSQYFYVINKLGLNNMGEINEHTAETDKILKNFNDFSTSVSDASSHVRDVNVDNIDKIAQQYKDVSDDYASIKANGEKLYGSIKAAADNPGELVQLIASIMKCGASNIVVGRLIAQPLCKMLVPKYIAHSKDADATLEKFGVVDGVDGMDFGLSNFIIDEKTINVVVVYKLKPVGFGIIDKELVIKQTASTAAWGGPTLKATKEKQDKSPWNQGQFEYGKHYADEMRDQYGENALKPGQGADAYFEDEASGTVYGETFPPHTFVSVHAMNIYSKSYSTYNKDPDTGKGVYTFTDKNRKAIKADIKKYANSLKNDIEKAKRKGYVICEDGTKVEIDKSGDYSAYLVMVVPADSSGEAKTLLNEIAREVESETGCKVDYTYRDKALTQEDDK